MAWIVLLYTNVFIRTSNRYVCKLIIARHNVRHIVCPSVGQEGFRAAGLNVPSGRWKNRGSKQAPHTPQYFAICRPLNKSGTQIVETGRKTKAIKRKEERQSKCSLRSPPTVPSRVASIRWGLVPGEAAATCPLVRSPTKRYFTSSQRTHFNIILPPKFRSSKWSYNRKFSKSKKEIVSICYFLRAWYIFFSVRLTS
jgi:hypothetical protein